MENVNCSLCGADASRSTLFRITVDRYTQQLFTLVKCKDCGLVYLNPRPDVNELSAFYPLEYEPFQLTGERFSVTPKQVKGDELRALEMQIDYIERFSPERGRLLDVGCANGRFLNIARKRGWQVAGVELSEIASQAARSQYDLDVFTGTLEEAGFAHYSFDVITLWDVLEHLPSPLGSLKLCWEILKPGGILAFSIPNIQSFDRYLFGSNWIGWDSPRHFTLFENDTLMRSLNEVNFSLIDQRCLLGGKGTFLLSMEIVLNHTSPWIRSALQPLLPLAGLMTWPYRQFAYKLRRGPIMYSVAQRGEAE